MSTVNLDLFVLWQRDRFVTSLTNPATPSLPAIVAGDTWDINVYFVDDTSPMQIHRFAGSDVSARIRAQGNNHGYADAAASAELGPASTAIAVTHYQNGVKPTTSEIQRVLLPATPIGGSYTLDFPGPTVIGAPSAIVGPKGSVTVYSDWTLTQIQDAIRALPFYEVFSGVLQDAPGYSVFLTLSGTPTDYHIDYGNGSDRKGPLPLVVVTANSLQFLYGWTITLPFTASDFSDYLVSANGPSFFEIILDGGQAGFVQLTGDPGGGNAPVFTNGPAPNSGVLGSPYSFAYAASGYPAPTFVVTSGGLPTGLTLASSGLLSGTPTVAGTFSGVITATNTNGDVTQDFIINIAASGGGGGIGGVGVLASYRDGNFNVLDYSDGPYPEDRNDEWPGLLIWHIPMCIDFDDYRASIPAVGSYEGPYGYFWKDTTPKFIGDGIVEFERLRHNLPADANRKLNTTKNIQIAQFTITSGHVTDMAIDSYSKDIEASCNYHYALDDAGPPPVVPFIQIIPYLRGQAMTDFGTGFPTGTRAGVPGLYTDNTAVSVLPGYSHDHILGRLFCRKILTG